MPRFFVKEENISESKVNIIGDDAFHIARSLRMAVGDEITVSDGKGAALLCTLTRIRDDECECEIKEKLECKTEPPFPITLCMAYPKGDKLEVVVQKAVELGATRIIPFESSRCIKRPKAEKQEKQTQRLNKIAEEAAKQCGRCTLPIVTPPMSYDNMLKEISKASLRIFCYEDESKKSIKDLLADIEIPKDAAVIVGSEGGFSPKEAEEAKRQGCSLVSLGGRILRCETAPDFALSVLIYRFEL